MLDFNGINIVINGKELNKILEETKINKEHFYDRQDGNTATLTYFFFTLLKRSSIINNFLLYSKKELKNYIGNIEILPNSGKYIDYKYVATIKTLVIKLDLIAIEDLRRFYTSFLSERFKDNDVWHKDFLENPLDIRGYHRTMPAIFKDENYIFTSFDPVLAHIKEFQELPDSVRQRILNCEFTKKEELGNMQNQEDIKKIIEGFISAETKKSTEILTNHIIEDYINISSLQNQINTYLSRIKEYQDKIESTNNTLKLALNIEKIPADIIRITRKPTNSGTLRFHTNPLFVNFDKEKLNTASNKIKDAVKNDFRFCIGTHIIDIEPGFVLRFTSKCEHKNHHIEDASCYGTFKNHIDAAQKAGQLEKLLFLAHKMLISATLGDLMGNRTLENALIVDKDGFIQSYNSTTRTFTPSQTHYIEKIKLQEESKGYYETCKTFL